MCPDIRMSQSALQRVTKSGTNQYEIWNMDDNDDSCRYSPQGCSEVNLIHQGSHNGERRGLSITLGTTKYRAFFLVGPPLFPYQKVKLLLAPRAAAPFKKAFGWLQVVFPFGTENGEGRIKTHTVHTVKGFIKYF